MQAVQDQKYQADLTRLLRYTPPATSIRLLTLNAINAYLTSWFLHRVGGARDPRLLLPAWIGIACVSGQPSPVVLR